MQACLWAHGAPSPQEYPQCCRDPSSPKTFPSLQGTWRKKLLGSSDRPSSSWVPAQGRGCWVGEGASPDPALLPLPEKSVPLCVLYEKYGESLTQDNLIKVVALLTEYQTGDVVVAIRDVYIQNPEIKIRVKAQHPVPGGFRGDISHWQGVAAITLRGWSQ